MWGVVTENSADTDLNNHPEFGAVLESGGGNYNCDCFSALPNVSVAALQIAGAGLQGGGVVGGLGGVGWARMGGSDHFVISSEIVILSISRSQITFTYTNPRSLRALSLLWTL